MSTPYLKLEFPPPPLRMPQQRPYRSKQDYATPAAFIRAVMWRLGIDRFKLDFAADQSNRKAGWWLGEADDALTVEDWARFLKPDEWGWLNPPYTNLAAWAKKCRETGAAGGHIAFLVPASVGTNWYRDDVDGHARVLFLNGRLAFIADQPSWLYPKDCLLALYGPMVTPGTEVWTWRQQVAAGGGAVDRGEPRRARRT